MFWNLAPIGRLCIGLTHEGCTALDVSLFPWSSSFHRTEFAGALRTHGAEILQNKARLACLYLMVCWDVRGPKLGHGKRATSGCNSNSEEVAEETSKSSSRSSRSRSRSSNSNTDSNQR